MAAAVVVGGSGKAPPTAAAADPRALRAEAARREARARSALAGGVRDAAYAAALPSFPRRR